MCAAKVGDIAVNVEVERDAMSKPFGQMWKEVKQEFLSNYVRCALLQEGESSPGTLRGKRMHGRGSEAPPGSAH